MLKDLILTVGIHSSDTTIKSHEFSITDRKTENNVIVFLTKSLRTLSAYD